MKAWSLFGLSTAGMVVFAVLYFSKPKTALQPRVISNTVTNVVVKEVPKEVEKIVTVPAAIPQQYISAMRFVSNLNNCDFVKGDQVLFGMKDVQVAYFVSDLKGFISEDEVRDRFELILRKNNVPISPQSPNFIRVEVHGYWGDTLTPTRDLLTYQFEVSFVEPQTVLRGGRMHKAYLTVWSQGGYGTVGRANAAKDLFDRIELEAEAFANAFLAANPIQ
jgi:hypothetical protein